MTARIFASAFCVAGVIAVSIAPANAAGFFFSTGSPDGLMASASRPTGPSFEIETGDDFVVTSPTTLTGGYVGPLPHRAMPKFPYDPAKDPPPAHMTEYDRAWNTRPAGRR